MLMKGSIVSAGEGNRDAARDAKCAARLVLGGTERPRTLCRSMSRATIGVLHPVFAKIAHFLRNQPVAEAALRPSHLNHAACHAPLMRPVPDAAVHD